MAYISEHSSVAGASLEVVGDLKFHQREPLGYRGTDTRFNVCIHIIPMNMKGCVCHCKVADTPFHIKGNYIISSLTLKVLKYFCVNHGDMNIKFARFAKVLIQIIHM